MGRTLPPLQPDAIAKSPDNLSTDKWIQELQKAQELVRKAVLENSDEARSCAEQNFKSRELMYEPGAKVLV